MTMRIVSRCRVLLLLFLSLAVMLQTASCEKKPVKRMGTDPIEAVMVDGESPLAGWIEKGYKGMTVVHLDLDDALGAVPEGDIKKAEGLRFDGDNYLSAAVRLGIVKEVYWVVPYPFFEMAGGGLMTRQFLFHTGAARNWNEASGLNLGKGCLNGLMRGVTVTICAPDTMPAIQSPVIVDIDTDFFPAFSGSRDINAVGGLWISLDSMFSRGYNVVEANIRAGRSGDPVELYAASEVREVLEDPSIFRNDTPPPQWDARNSGESLLAGHEFDAAYSALKDTQEELGKDSGVRALLAEAALRTGKHDEALKLAGDLCIDDMQYCSLLVYLGSIGDEMGLGAKMDPFFQLALEKSRDRAFAEERYADVLLKRNERDMARMHFEEAVSAGGGFSPMVKLGSLLYEDGNIGASLKQFRSAFDVYDYRPLPHETAAGILNSMEAAVRTGGEDGELEKVLKIKERLLTRVD